MKRTTPSNQKYFIGSYLVLSKKEYVRVCRRIGSLGFHRAEGIWGFTIKIINDEIRDAVVEVKRIKPGNRK